MSATIDIADLRLFVEVARLASFVGAARKTGILTSSVSRAVARLEGVLAVRLLHRLQIVCTGAGPRSATHAGCSSLIPHAAAVPECITPETASR